MSFLLGKNKNEEQNIIILDIGSDSIGGAIAKINSQNNTPKIVKTIRIEISYIDIKNFDLLTDNMASTVLNVVFELYKNKIGKIDEIFCVMTSPWYLSENRIIRISKEHSFVFTKKIADDLVNKEITNIKEEYKNKYKGTGEEVNIMESHIMKVFLNGYKTNNPIGMKSRQVEMDMMISLSSSACLNKIKKSLEKVYHATPVIFSSFMFSSYLTVRDRYISPDSYLLLDISGEITEVGIVSKGILISSLSFPFGKKTLYRYICTKLNIELRDAKELLSLYVSNSLSSKRKEKITPLFDSIEKSWGESFRECVSNLPHSISLPDTIFLTADNDIKKWFVDIIKREEYSPFLTTKYNPNVIPLEGSDFLSMCVVNGGHCDPFLMIESIAYCKKNEVKNI